MSFTVYNFSILMPNDLGFSSPRTALQRVLSPLLHLPHAPLECYDLLPTSGAFVYLGTLHILPRRLIIWTIPYVLYRRPCKMRNNTSTPRFLYSKRRCCWPTIFSVKTNRPRAAITQLLLSLWQSCVTCTRLARPRLDKAGSLRPLILQNWRRGSALGGRFTHWSGPGLLPWIDLR